MPAPLVVDWDGPRIVVWFSYGAASAVAAAIAVEKYPDREVHIINCDTRANEHPDNARFCADVERWIGRCVTVISSAKYATIEDVFEKTRYMSGIEGARCTIELKKIPRFAFQQADDIHIFGLTADETKRIADFEQRNPELHLEWVLRDLDLTKADCLALLEFAEIPLPVMYGLGFKNNNCIGCVKATSPAYWNLVREHFPDVFRKRAEQSRSLGVRLTRVGGVRIFLDELAPDIAEEVIEDLSCGPQCTATESNVLVLDW